MSCECQCCLNSTEILTQLEKLTAAIVPVPAIDSIKLLTLKYLRSHGTVSSREIDEYCDGAYTRHSIRMALYTMNKRGQIHRIATGVYAKA